MNIKIVARSEKVQKASARVESARVVREIIDEMWHAQVRIRASQWRNFYRKIDATNDRIGVEVDGEIEFNGRLKSVDRESGGVYELTIASFELDAKEAEPTPAEVFYQHKPASSIFESLIDGDPIAEFPLEFDVELGIGIPIDGVPTLSVGEISGPDPTVSFSVNTSNYAKAIRDLAEEVGAEVRYNNDMTVDWLADGMGEDNTGLELSPENGTLVGQPNIHEDIEIGEATHVLGLGAESGDRQLRYEATTNNYDATGEREVWVGYENTDIVQQDHLEQAVQNVVGEINDADDHMEIDGVEDPLAVESGSTFDWEFDVEMGDRIYIGDWIHVDIPKERVKRDIRVVETIRTWDADGETVGIVLSTHEWADRDTDRKRRSDLNSFNRGYRGNSQSVQIASGWDNAGDGHDQELTVYDWPSDIEIERFATLHVSGRAWRSPVSMRPHTHPFDASHAHNLAPEVHDHLVELETTSGDDSEWSLVAGQKYEEERFTVSEESGWHDATEPFEFHGDTDLDPAEPFSHGTFHTWWRTINANSNVLVAFRLYDLTNERPWPREGGSLPVWIMSEYSYVPLDVFADIHESECVIQYRVVWSGEADDWDLRFTGNFVAGGHHVHAIEDVLTSSQESIVAETEIVSRTTDAVSPMNPEVVTSFEGDTYYPKDVRIEVDGDHITTIDGDHGDWTEDVDLTGVLTSGNPTITAEPTTGRGEVFLQFTAEVFRRSSR